jgi:DNA-3-methyladenine glycosylase
MAQVKQARKLPRRFYNRSTLEVARDLLGKRIVVDSGQGRLSASIVEVEAYVGEDDPACHAACGMTRRNEIMYGTSGFSYVYFIYGMYHCFNIVTEREGYPAAVLVRAAEPVEGLPIMLENSPNGTSETVLSGPGKFCRSLGIGLEHNGIDLTRDAVFVEDPGIPVGSIGIGPRIGIKKGVELPYRYFLIDSPSVSAR